MSFGQENSPYRTPSSLSPIRIVLEEDTGAFFTWEQEQQIIAKLIYKNIYKDDLQAAIALYVEESNKHENTKKMLQLQRNNTAQVEHDLRTTQDLLEYTKRLEVTAEDNYLKEEKRKRRWRRAATVGPVAAAAVGFIIGILVLK